MSLTSMLGLGDTGTLWGPLYQMVDPLESLLDKDEEEALAKGVPSPFSSSPTYAVTYTAPLPILSPSSPHLSLLGDKMEADLLSLPWLSDELLDATISPDASKEDGFSGMDWMAEKIDLSEFDLDSLVGPCDTDGPPASPEDLVASLETHMDLDPLPVCTAFTSIAEVDDSLSEIAACPSVVPEKPEVKLEPPSPVPSPSLPPSSPSFTLDLGSEVDVSESEKVVPTESTLVPKIVLSFSPSLVLVLSPEEKLPPTSISAPVAPEDLSDSDSGISSVAESPCHQPCHSPLSLTVCTSQTKPYSTSSKSAVVPAGKVKSASTGMGSKVVEKKLKKMEQNKTAATRYRQKKRAEQEALHVQCTELEKRNRELVEKADSISKEIQYLKDLMEEVRNAKSRRNKGANRVVS